MQTRSTLLNVCLILAATHALTGSALRGDTIVSVTGSDNGGDLLDGSGSQILEAGWSSTQAYQNASISALLSDIPGLDPTVTAYLTTQIGPSATAASEVTAPTTINIAQGVTAEYTLFSSLNLAPGNYYLVLTANDGGDTLLWDYTNSPTITTAAGVSLTGNGIANTAGQGTLNTSYAPASTFAALTNNLLFTVTGTPMAAVPEPSSLAPLLFLGLCGISCRRAKFLS